MPLYPAQQLAGFSHKRLSVKCGGGCGRAIPISKAQMKFAVKAYCGHCAALAREQEKAKR